jgi:hypothetical protein
MTVEMGWGNPYGIGGGGASIRNHPPIVIPAKAGNQLWGVNRQTSEQKRLLGPQQLACRQ